MHAQQPGKSRGNRLRNRRTTPLLGIPLLDAPDTAQPVGAGALGFTRMEVASEDDHAHATESDKQEHTSQGCCTMRWFAVVVVLSLLVGGLVSVLVLWKVTQDDLTSSNDELGAKIAESSAAQLKQSADVNQSLSDRVAMLAVHMEYVNATLSREVESVAEENAAALLTSFAALREDVSAVNSTVAEQVSSLRDADAHTHAVIEATERRLVSYTDSGVNSTRQEVQNVLGEIQLMSEASEAAQNALAAAIDSLDSITSSNITTLSTLVAESASEASAGISRVQTAVQAQAAHTESSLAALNTSLTQEYTRGFGELTAQTQTALSEIRQVTEDLAGTIEAMDEDVTQFKDHTAQSFLDVHSSLLSVDTKLEEATNLTLSSVAEARSDLARDINETSSRLSNQTLALVAIEAALRVEAVSSVQVAVNTTKASVLNLQGRVEDVSRTANTSIAALEATVLSNNMTTAQEIRRLNTTLVTQSSQISTLGGNVSELITMASNTATMRDLATVSNFVTNVRENVDILFNQSLPRMASEIDKLNISARELGVSLSNLRSDFAALDNGTIITTLRAQVSAVQASVDNKTSALSDSTNASLVSLRAVVDTKAPLNTTQALTQNLTSTQSTLALVGQNVTALQSSAASLQTQVSSVQTQANTLQTQMSSVQAQVAVRANQTDLSALQTTVTNINNMATGTATKSLQDQVTAVTTTASTKAAQSDFLALQTTVTNIVNLATGTVTKSLQDQVNARALQADLATLQTTVTNIVNLATGTVTKSLQDQVNARALQTDLVTLQSIVTNINNMAAGTATRSLQDQVSVRANQSDFLALQTVVANIVNMATGTVTKSLQDQVTARALQTDLVTLQTTLTNIINMATGTVTKSLQDQITANVQTMTNLANKATGTVTRNLQDQIDTKASQASLNSVNASVALMTSAFTGKANVADFATLNASVATIRDLLSNSATLQNVAQVSQLVTSVQSNTTSALDAVQRVDLRVSQVNATLIANYTTRTDFVALQNNVAGLANGALLSQVQSNVSQIQQTLPLLQSGLASAQAATSTVNSSLSASLQSGLGTVQSAIASMNSSHQSGLASLQSGLTSLNSSLTSSLQSGLTAAQANLVSLNSSLQSGLASAQAATASLNSSLTSSLQSGLTAAQANLLSVNASLATALSSVRVQLDNKTDLSIASCMQSQIDALSATTTSLTSYKADASTVTTVQQNFANLQSTVSTLSTSTTAALALKADVTVTADLQTQMNAKASTTALAAKADTTAMNTALAAKVDTTAMVTALSIKADTTAMNTALAAKADTTAVNTALAAKADTTAMNTALATKASFSDVEALKVSAKDLLARALAEREYTLLLATLMDKIVLAPSATLAGGLVRPDVTINGSNSLVPGAVSVSNSYVYNAGGDTFDSRGDHVMFNASLFSQTWFLRRASDFYNIGGSPSSSSGASILVVTVPGEYEVTVSYAISSIQRTVTTSTSHVVLYVTPQRFLNGFRDNLCRYPGGGASGASSIVWGAPRVLAMLSGGTGTITGKLLQSDFTNSLAYSVQLGVAVVNNQIIADCGGPLVCGCSSAGNLLSVAFSQITLRVRKITPAVIPFGGGVELGRIRVRVFQTPAGIPAQGQNDDEKTIANRMASYLATSIDLNITAFPDRPAFTFSNPTTEDGRTSYYYHLVLADTTLGDPSSPRYLRRDSQSAYYKQCTLAVAGGYIKFPSTGSFDVNIWVDDGFYMWIGSKLSPSPARSPYWTGNSNRGFVNVSIDDLSELWQPFTVYVYQSGGDAYWRIAYRPSGTTEWKDFTSDMIAS